MKGISTKNGGCFLNNPGRDRLVVLLCASGAFVFYAGAAILVATSLGCNTVRPAIAKSSQASWDGTNQNSGLIGIAPDGRRILSSHARDRYNGLMREYGEFFEYPVRDPDEGITATGTNTFLIDPQHEAYFMDALRWEKQKNPPWHR